MKRITVLLTLAALLFLAGSVLAQSSAGYDLSWWTVDGGGYTFSSGGDYTLGGGFWGGGAAAGYKVYLPMILRQYP